MMTFNGKAPFEIGNVKVVGWVDTVVQPFKHNELTTQKTIRASVKSRSPRIVTVDFLVMASHTNTLNSTLTDLGLWLTGAINAKLVHHHEFNIYYKATCSSLTEPDFNGLSARLTAVFSCSDPRPYNTATDMPLTSEVFETQDFTFGGNHCLTDFGLMFSQDSFDMSPPVIANKYNVSGMNGTLRYTGIGETLGERKLTGKLYFTNGTSDEPLTYSQAQAKIHAVSAWLVNAGRSSLIFDFEPTKQYTAEVIEPISFSRSNWESGYAQVTFLLQPFAEDVTVASQITNITNLTSGYRSVALTGFVTAFETPFTLSVKNTGAAAITKLIVRVGSTDVMTLDNSFSLPVGSSVVIDSSAMTVKIGSTSKIQHMAGDFPFIPANGTSISIKGVGDNNCEATLTARGRTL